MLSGKQLKMKRILLDIKAKEIAEYLHIDKSYVSKMENEVQAIPSNTYGKWIEFLGIDQLNEGEMLWKM